MAGEVQPEFNRQSLGIAIEERAWQDFANCLDKDPDLFFPKSGDDTRPAKEICRQCVVRMDCL